MSSLSAKREALGLSVVQVHQELNRRGIPVAFSTVASWFNGNRGVRKMEHLKALCDVLRTTLDELARDEIEIAEQPEAIVILRELEKLTPVQREAVLAMVRAMQSS